MGTKLNKNGYEKLLTEDLDWLRKQPRTLERDHVVMIVEQSVQHYYPPTPSEPQSVAGTYSQDVMDEAVRQIVAISMAGIKLCLMMKVHPNTEPVEYSVQVPIGQVVKVCDGVHIKVGK